MVASAAANSAGLVGRAHALADSSPASNTSRISRLASGATAPRPPGRARSSDRRRNRGPRRGGRIPPCGTSAICERTPPAVGIQVGQRRFVQVQHHRVDQVGQAGADLDARRAGVVLLPNLRRGPAPAVSRAASSESRNVGPESWIIGHHGKDHGIRERSGRLVSRGPRSQDARCLERLLLPFRRCECESVSRVRDEDFAVADLAGLGACA